jgi:hypothetical protein
MEFQKERVFTALNADELKIGSKVIIGDTVEALRNRVRNGTAPLTLSEIRSDGYERRFRVEEYTEPESAYSFVYLVSLPEETWIAYICRGKNTEPYLTACRSDCWEMVQKDYGTKTKLFEGSEVEVDNWYVTRRHLANEIAAWEDGKTIQFFDDSIGDWVDVEKPKWSTNTKYRIKPNLRWTDLKIGDVIQSGNFVAMVTGIDSNPATPCHIHAYDWISDEELEEWEKVE